MLLYDYKNIIKILISNGTGQLLAFLCFPFLAYVYSIDDFSNYAIFFSISMVLGAISTGKYELAIMLPKTTSLSWSVTLLSLLNCAITFIIFTFAVFIVNRTYITIGHIEGIMLAVCAFSIGVNNTLLQFATRIELYNVISIANFMRFLSLPLLQILMSKLGALGLTLGLAISFTIPSALLFIMILRSSEVNMYKASSKMWLVAQRYRKFVYFSLPGELINIINQHIVTFVVAGIFNKEALGLYFFINRLLMFPMSLCSAAISPVFYRRMKTIGYNSDLFFTIIIKYLTLLSLISTCFYIFSVSILPKVIEHFFDPKWLDSIIFIPLIALFVSIRFTSSTLSVILSFKEYNQQFLFINILLSLLNASVISFTKLNGLDIYSFIEIYANCLAVFYAALILYYLYISTPTQGLKR